MTNVQLYVAIGVPALMALSNLAVMLVIFQSFNSRLQRVEDRLDSLIGAVNDLDKRLIKVELKLGIQPE